MKNSLNSVENVFLSEICIHSDAIVRVFVLLEQLTYPVHLLTTILNKVQVLVQAQINLVVKDEKLLIIRFSDHKR